MAARRDSGDGAPACGRRWDRDAWRPQGHEVQAAMGRWRRWRRRGFGASGGTDGAALAVSSGDDGADGGVDGCCEEGGRDEG
ncbi:hypothetical protein GUJ93_ZPchr0001g31417 [Zizania palustris]|uniref:Uncharacterized protein n=1 Tax=Zizania palustris TaxID=103762 RepID=A0A8J5SBV1_ZIZPA|nr:hypothetical protein GUJ93_ZPchr0001g31417 [Zizania palustris]